MSKNLLLVSQLQKCLPGQKDLAGVASIGSRRLNLLSAMGFANHLAGALDIRCEYISYLLLHEIGIVRRVSKNDWMFTISPEFYQPTA